MKRTIGIFLIISVLLSSTGCLGSFKGEKASQVIKPSDEAKVEINIITMPGMYNWTKAAYFSNYKRDFEKKYGVKVNYVNIEDTDSSRILMTKLSVKGGPELVLDSYPGIMKLADQGAVVDIKDKLANLSKVYSSLINEQCYYLPIGLNSKVTVINKEMLEQLHIEVPDLDWGDEDYYRLREKWLLAAPRMLSYQEITEVFYKHLKRLSIFDYKNKSVSINTPEFKKALEDIRSEIYSGRFKINEKYTYENYYNLLFEYTSKECIGDRDLQGSKEYLEQHWLDRTKSSVINIFSAKDINSYLNRKYAVRPDSRGSEYKLWSLGFMVNKNGANLELAYEFLNGLLSDDVQMSMFQEEYADLYPVNKDIESSILEVERLQNYSSEAMELKNYALDKLKTGDYKLYILYNMDEHDQYWMLVRDIAKFIFTGREYTDVELSAELQKLENKYKIWLSE